MCSDKYFLQCVPLDIIKNGYVTNGKVTIELTFDDFNELARFSMLTLLNMAVQDGLEMRKIAPILYLLQSNSLSVHESSRDLENSKYLGNEVFFWVGPRF